MVVAARDHQSNVNNAGVVNMLCPGRSTEVKHSVEVVDTFEQVML